MENEISKKQHSFHQSTILVIAALVGFLMFGAWVIQPLALANGYGYGYGACTADRPRNLSADLSTNKRNLIFSWDEVVFTDCADEAAASYRLQIRFNDGTLVQSYDNLSHPTKTITLKALKRNHAYKFRIRAVATDGTSTDWSLYKLFRTPPRRPAKIFIRDLSSHAVEATWRNVVRSERLKYYQVVVQRKRHTVFEKKVRLGLRHTKTGVIVRRLRSAKSYTIKVRAVANKTTFSQYQSQRFTTLSE